jgi:hypothetical protein
MKASKTLSDFNKITTLLEVLSVSIVVFFEKIPFMASNENT